MLMTGENINNNNNTNTSIVTVMRRLGPAHPTRAELSSVLLTAVTPVPATRRGPEPTLYSE